MRIGDPAEQCTPKDNGHHERVCSESCHVFVASIGLVSTPAFIQRLQRFDLPFHRDLGRWPRLLHYAPLALNPSNNLMSLKYVIASLRARVRTAKPCCAHLTISK